MRIQHTGGVGLREPDHLEENVVDVGELLREPGQVAEFRNEKLRLIGRKPHPIQTKRRLGHALLSAVQAGEEQKNPPITRGSEQRDGRGEDSREAGSEFTSTMWFKTKSLNLVKQKRFCTNVCRVKEHMETLRSNC